jgi:hypothetical protein
MGMIVTTSTGTRDNNGDLEWINPPGQSPDATDQLLWSASAGSVIDALVATGIVDEGECVTDLECDINDARDKVEAAMMQIGSHDEYLSPRLAAVSGVIHLGLRHGATHLIVS